MKITSEENADLPKKVWIKPEVIDLDKNSGDVENGNPPNTTADITFMITGGS